MSGAVQAAVSAIQRYWRGAPQTAVILGTGLGPLADAVRGPSCIPYAAIPGFPRSTALSHRGMLVCGRLADQTVAVMSGRGHRYEGYSAAEIAFPVRVLHALGARTLVVSNASGGVRPSFQPGDIMAITSHINLQGQAPPWPPRSTPRSRLSGDACYDPQLIDRTLAVGRRLDISVQRGVYVAVTGPNYETRAEYRMFRRIGGDSVGMSTVPEVLAAAQGGMRVLGLSMITNVARPDAPQYVDAEDVVRVAAAGSAKLLHIVQEVLRQSM